MSEQPPEAEKARIKDDLGVAARKLIRALNQFEGLVSADGPKFRCCEKAPDELRAVRSYLKARRLRERLLPADLFGEPAWDILLDLYAAGLEGRLISVSSACLASAVPATTALRWLSKLVESGLIERSLHDTDARGVNVNLTPMGEEAISKWVAAALLDGPAINIPRYG